MEIPTPEPTQPQESVPVRYDISEFVNKRSFWVSKIFMRGTVRSSLIFGLIISILFFITAILFSAITFNNLQVDTISFDHVIDFFTLEGKTAEDIQWIAEFYFMPVYLLVHFIMLTVIHFELKKSLIVVPKLVNMPEKELKKRIKRVTSNSLGFIVALPFILYDSYFTYIDITDPTATQPLLSFLANLSWIIEWLIFGIVIYSLMSFTLFVRHITKYYQYEENILSIVIKGKSEPLTNLGYKNAFIFGGFTLFSVIYMIITGYWLSDFIALLLMFLVLPIVAIFPLQMVQNKVKQEQNTMIDDMTDRFVDYSMKFIADEQSVEMETKMNLFLTSKILDELKQYKKETLKVYLRLVWVLGVSVIGILVNFQDILVPFILDILSFGGR
jgi:hypothetical protein